HGLPGAVRKPKERGERDTRLAAGVTLHEFETLLIYAILHHNRRRIEGFRLQKDMITDQVPPRPTDLWEWGVENRTGHLRAADPEIVRANLLPWAKATVTYRGIKYGHLFYGSQRAMHQHWYEKARATRTWQVEVAYDPRSVDVIYLRVPGVRTPERCELLPVDHRFKGLSWSDVEDFFLSQKEARDDSRTRDHQALADFHAPVAAIVKNAVAAATAANSGLTKAAQLCNVRENREAERRLESAAASTAPKPGHNTGNGNGKASYGDKLSSEYVPPPSPVEMLRKQRESKWNGNE
ncbi:MAG TPA: Mu transposase C-terminal domain-containing protein, partial [Puia sp.]|nr:Mu transposase C-terminal domain-containing protein [Puia sp.]